MGDSKADGQGYAERSIRSNSYLAALEGALSGGAVEQVSSEIESAAAQLKSDKVCREAFLQMLKVNSPHLIPHETVQRLAMLVTPLNPIPGAT
jgi:hypothetical protein